MNYTTGFMTITTDDATTNDTATDTPTTTWAAAAETFGALHSVAVDHDGPVYVVALTGYDPTRDEHDLYGDVAVSATTIEKTFGVEVLAGVKA